MGYALPWNVRGIDPDIKELAVEAAHRAGMPVGQWLSHVLADSLPDFLEEEEEIALPRRRGRRRSSRINEMNARLERILRPRAAPRYNDNREEDSAAYQLLETALQALEGEDSGSPLPSKSSENAALIKAIQSLEGQVAELKSQQNGGLPAQATNTPSHQRHSPNHRSALEEIEARRRMLDGAPPAQAMPRTPQQAEPIHPREPAHEPAREPAPDPLMEDLRHRLDQLMSRFDEVNNKPEPVSPALQARLDQIAAQLDFVKNAPRPDVQMVQAKLDQISARLDATQSALRPETALLQAQLESIAKRIEDFRAMQKPEGANLQSRLEQIATRIEEVRHNTQLEAPRLTERIDHIAGRIDGWNVPSQDDLMSMRRDLSQLANSLEALSPQRLVGVVENAMAQIAEKSYYAQQQNLPDRLVEPIEQIQDDIREVLREVGSSRLSDRVTHEISIIARKLDQISRGAADFSRLDEVLRETNAIKSLVTQAVRNQPLEGLAHQIEILGRHLDVFQRDPQNFSDQKLLDTIQDLRDRVERIDPKATFSGMEARLKVIADIEARLGSMTGIEEKLGEIARNVTQLKNEKRADFPERDNAVPHLETITAKLDKIASSIDRSVSGPVPASPDIAEKQHLLTQLLERLENRIENTKDDKAESGSFDALHTEIARLANKIEENNGNPSGFNEIVKNITSLCQEIELAKKDMVSLAESAAERAAREAIRSFSRDDTTETLAAEGLLLMRRDLGEFKSAQSESELRTQKTLQALQETMQGLVNRFSELENGNADKHAKNAHFSQPIPKHDVQNVFPSEPQPQPVPGQAPSPAKQNAAKLGATAKAQKSAQNIEFNDLPLEPGMQPDFTAAAPTELISADPKSNFIASARRAVQLAATQSQAGSDEPQAEVASSKEPSEKAKTHMRTPRQHGAFAGKTRKYFLLLLASVIFAAGAMSLMSMRSPMPDAGDKLSVPEIPLGKQNKDADGQKNGDVNTQGKRSTNNPPSPLQSTPISPIETPSSLPKPAKPTPPSLETIKQNQCLSELGGAMQADPLTVGSIQPEGQPKPSVAQEDIVELASQSQLKSQDKLREAAIAANPAALFEVGSRLLDGKGGLPKDAQLAARWFEKASNLGHAPSQYRLAGLYREGRGQPKDAGIAFEWFEKAASQGHVLAMHNAAVLLAEGVHGTPDYANAALWFKKAAEHGIKDSQFNIAILYARGLGVNQDLVESYRWFSAAAAQGDQDAAKKRDDIAARLTKDQLTKEKDWVKTFNPTKADPLINEAGQWDSDVASAEKAPSPTNPKKQRSK